MNYEQAKRNIRRNYASEEEMLYCFDNHKDVHFPQAEGGRRLLSVLSWSDRGRLLQ